MWFQKLWATSWLSLEIRQELIEMLAWNGKLLIGSQKHLYSNLKRHSIDMGHLLSIGYAREDLQLISFIYNHDVTLNKATVSSDLLMRACSTGRLSLIKYIKTKMEFFSNYWFKCLKKAASNGHLYVLHHYFTDFMQMSYPHQFKILKAAVKSGHTELVWTLLNMDDMVPWSHSDLISLAELAFSNGNIGITVNIFKNLMFSHFTWIDIRPCTCVSKLEEFFEKSILAGRYKNAYTFLSFMLIYYPFSFKESTWERILHKSIEEANTEAMAYVLAFHRPYNSTLLLMQDFHSQLTKDQPVVAIMPQTGAVGKLKDLFRPLQDLVTRLKRWYTRWKNW